MRLLSIAILFSLSTISYANDAGLSEQAIRNAETLRSQALQSNSAYTIVESLTTEVGPRLAGSDGYERATVWAQEKFKGLGFDKVWLQPVSYPIWQRNSESGQILSPYPQKLTLTALGGSVGTQGALSAETVEFSSFEALSAAPDGSLKGKIAFVNLKMQREINGSGYGPVSNIRVNGASIAAQKGAIAFIMRSAGTDTDRLPHTGVMRYKDGISKIPAAALSVPDADLLALMIKRGKPVVVELKIDAGYIGTKTEYNVIGEITGESLPNEYVVIGGHLDSWDLGTGAIDDGAGVAITMAAGALIGNLKKAPKRTIRVIAYANEEQGLFGGKAYAEAMKNNVAKHQIGAESDFGAGKIYALYAGVNEASWPVMEQIANILQPIGIELDKTKGGPGPDIGPMAELGMPWAALAQDGTDYFDYHHTANDTLDKIDPEALKQQVAAYAVFAYLAAETDIDFEPKAEQK